MGELLHKSGQIEWVFEIKRVFEMMGLLVSRQIRFREFALRRVCWYWCVEKSVGWYQCVEKECWVVPPVCGKECVEWYWWVERVCWVKRNRGENNPDGGGPDANTLKQD
eukprot:1393722-Amorphochlora_amoeboformis.AAC.3